MPTQMQDPVTQVGSFNVKETSANLNQDADRKLQVQMAYLKAKHDKEMADTEAKLRRELSDKSLSATASENEKQRGFEGQQRGEQNQFAQQQQERMFQQQEQMRQQEEAMAVRASQRAQELEAKHAQNELKYLQAGDETVDAASKEYEQSSAELSDILGRITALQGEIDRNEKLGEEVPDELKAHLTNLKKSMDSARDNIKAGMNQGYQTWISRLNNALSATPMGLGSMQVGTVAAEMSGLNLITGTSQETRNQALLEKTNALALKNKLKVGEVPLDDLVESVVDAMSQRGSADSENMKGSLKGLLAALDAKAQSAARGEDQEILKAHDAKIERATRSAYAQGFTANEIADVVDFLGASGFTLMQNANGIKTTKQAEGEAGGIAKPGSNEAELLRKVGDRLSRMRAALGPAMRKLGGEIGYVDSKAMEIAFTQISDLYKMGKSEDEIKKKLSEDGLSDEEKKALDVFGGLSEEQKAAKPGQAGRRQALLESQAESLKKTKGLEGIKMKREDAAALSQKRAKLKATAESIYPGI